MGRELRLVPPNWRHPQVKHEYSGEMRDQPMFDENFDDVFAAWLVEFDRIRSDDLTDNERGYWPRRLADWLRDAGAPPDPAYYRPWRDDEATWFQVWQTVSEGSPVTPPFETKEELVEYLVENGDFWDQKRWRDGDRFMQPTKPGYSREAAERFVMGSGWAPSMVMIQDEHGSRVFSGISAASAE